MKLVNLSDKIASFSNITMTDKRELLLFHPTNNPWDMKFAKPEWFDSVRGIVVTTYTELLPLTEMRHRNVRPAKHFMVFALNLKSICHEERTGVEEYIDGLVITRGGRKFLLFTKNVETNLLSQCRLLEYDLFRQDREFIRHVATLSNDGIDSKTKLWRQLTNDCVVVI